MAHTVNVNFKLRYDSEMKEDGITEILKFGIAFSGKKVCVRTE